MFELMLGSMIAGVVIGGSLRWVVAALRKRIVRTGRERRVSSAQFVQYPGLRLLPKIMGMACRGEYPWQWLGIDAGDKVTVYWDGWTGDYVVQWR